MRVFWTDGSAFPNPGPGGFAVLEDGKPVVLGKEADSSNIRMEGSAIIAAMELAAEEECTINTDSEFWVNVLTKWAPGWEARGWKKASRGPIQNLDLVKRAYGLYSSGRVKLNWVHGHSGVMMNEEADQWAAKAREGFSLSDK